MDGEARASVRDALLAAYPSQGALERLLDQIDHPLVGLAPHAATLPDIVFKVVEAAIAENWLKRLLDHAAANSGNRQLAEVARLSRGVRRASTEDAWNDDGLDDVVRDAYRFETGRATKALGLPTIASWNATELTAARDEAELRLTDAPELVRHAQLLAALAAAAQAKPVVAALDEGMAPLRGLIRIYTVHVGSPPAPPPAPLERGPRSAGISVDLLLVEAASVLRQPGDELTALTRFVLGIALEHGVNLADRADPRAEALVRWISGPRRRAGDQLGEAERHLANYAGRPTWLIIDLGGEREDSLDASRDDDLWPRRLTAQLCVGEDEALPQVITCASSADLEPALSRLLGLLELPAQGLVIDIIAPRALFARRVDRLAVRALAVDEDDCDALARDCRPRLRWSQRRNSERRRQQARRWVRGVQWQLDAVTVTAEQADARDQAEQRLRTYLTSPLVVGSDAGVSAGADPLAMLLRKGCGFVLWFGERVDQAIATKVIEAQRTLAVAAVRSELPELLDLVAGDAFLLWDDPDGRDGLRPVPAAVRCEEPGG
jgi:hypothetical protein